MSKVRRTLSVDFDGTIVDHAFPQIGALKPGVRESMEKLHKDYTIVISSCRASAMFNRGKENPFVKEMKDFLDKEGIPYDRIDMGDEGKVVAVAYIDDRAIPFNDNWKEIADRLVKKG